MYLIFFSVILQGKNSYMGKHYIILLVAILLLSSCSSNKKLDRNPTVEVKQEGEKFVLYRHGEPYYIKGAAGTEQLEKIALYGGNSVRTWNMKEADRILEEAERLGLTVTLGLEVGKEWWGEDFNYLNPFAVNEKIEELKEVIIRYKDHPALLMWGVGNEVHLYGGNQILVLHTIDKIAKMIHETDPDHPVMTTVPLGPNFEKRGVMRLICPNIDILGVNGFKKIPDLYGLIRSTFGWNMAYILSEWGPSGPWEVASTEWGAPVEHNSTTKAELTQKHWQFIQKDTTLCLGSYAFYWGAKYERTYTFYSLFSPDGEETESVNELKRIWSGKIPDNTAPKIEAMVIQDISRKENIYLSADSLYKASVIAHDLDGDSLFYCWELRAEGKDNFEPGHFDQNLEYLLLDEGGSHFAFRTPNQEGGYRLICYVYDGHEHASTSNIPFYVKLYK